MNIHDEKRPLCPSVHKAITGEVLKTGADQVKWGRKMLKREVEKV